MSRAFDTISRHKLMEILEHDVKLNDDELRICHSLLAQTTIQVRLGKVLSSSFQSTIGTPQGDGLSPILFAIYLEKALQEVRIQFNCNRPLCDVKIPLEVQYADDSDYWSLCPNFLQELKSGVPEVIRKYDLIVNDSKWEETCISLNEDKWKSTKKLGSLLDVENDIKRRMTLATNQFKSLTRLWDSKGKVRVAVRLHMYKALVLPVLLYNCGTWGAEGSVMEKLDIFHRRQLRRVLGITRLDKVSNKELYKRCGIERPISEEVKLYRWNLFGHMLRLNLDTPAQKAMNYYYEKEIGDDGNEEKQPRGRPLTTLPVLLYQEYSRFLEKRPPQEKFLSQMRELAQDRKKWNSFVNELTKSVKK